MTTAHLHGLAYSPWTERARWALDHHHVGYKYHEHVPFLGEWLLRFRGRALRQRPVSVPLFIRGRLVLGDSLAIITHADAEGSGDPLIGDEAKTRAFRDEVEGALRAIRARVTGEMLDDREALRDAATAVSPKLLAPALAPVAALGARFVAHKYQADLHRPQENLRAVRQVLDHVRRTLGGAQFLEGGTFGALDLLAATLLQGIQPVRAPHIPLPAALRRAWTWPRLAEEYSDLIEWRDSLYAGHRPPPRAAAA